MRIAPHLKVYDMTWHSYVLFFMLDYGGAAAAAASSSAYDRCMIVEIKYSFSLESVLFFF